MQTVILQKGRYVIHASFHLYSDTVELPMEVWAAELANALQ